MIKRAADAALFIISNGPHPTPESGVGYFIRRASFSHSVRETSPAIHFIFVLCNVRRQYIDLVEIGVVARQPEHDDDVEDNND
jgi:hypothetical protein